MVVGIEKSMYLHEKLLKSPQIFFDKLVWLSSSFLYAICSQNNTRTFREQLFLEKPYILWRKKPIPESLLQGMGAPKAWKICMIPRFARTVDRAARSHRFAWTYEMLKNSSYGQFLTHQNAVARALRSQIERGWSRETYNFDSLNRFIWSIAI